MKALGAALLLTLAASATALSSAATSAFETQAAFRCRVARSVCRNLFLEEGWRYRRCIHNHGCPAPKAPAAKRFSELWFR
jgi:hypothetical protein